jgi:Restriction alleviation protein Lar
MNDAVELKPCPFCGAGVALQEWRGDDETEYVGIRCECSAEVSRALHWYGDDIAARGAEASAAWNTRADLATAAETAAREEGVRLGLMAAADRLAIQRTAPRDDPPRDAWERGNDSGVGACQTLLRALAADPAQVAKIAASVKGGE